MNTIYREMFDCYSRCIVARENRCHFQDNSIDKYANLHCQCAMALAIVEQI